MRKYLLAGVAVIAVAGFGSAANAQTQIEWWHAMGGALGQKVEAIAAAFNATQDEFEVVAINRGNYTETMTGAIAAFRAGEQPHIVQVFEVGTATMMSAEGAIKPVFELMQENGKPFSPDGFLKAVTGYYTNDAGQMLSMPFNSSTPVLYYNKDMFAQAGLDADSPPQTWPEMAEVSRQLISSGAASCGFSTAWQSWVQLENFSARHDIAFASKNNGFGGLDTELLINGPTHVKHIQSLADWSKEDIFKYGGRRGDGQALFTSGECGMWMNSSAGLAGIRRTADFDFGVAQLPFWPDVVGQPKNTIIGGASLWVMGGHETEEYRGVAEFFQFLSSSGIQSAWHEASGYLPITPAAFTTTTISGYYDRNPGADTAVIQMTSGEPTGNSKGLRLGNFVQIRDVINEELEAVWGGTKSAQQGLDAAVERGNQLLRRFERANR